AGTRGGIPVIHGPEDVNGMIIRWFAVPNR
ncbi:MAG: hypothetical protein QOJ20_287, partial [Mycobacterium sp.]|nr:hypothetical protein [Mycobacterium sp.]